MPIKNIINETTISVQSDPTDNGNATFQQQYVPANVASVTIDNFGNNVTLSNTKRNRSRREQSQMSHEVAVPIPQNSYSRMIQPPAAASAIVKGFSTMYLKNSSYNRKNDNFISSGNSSIKLGNSVSTNKLLLENSISNLRPEIIATLEWIPGKSNRREDSPINSLIDVRYTMRMLQVENVQEAIKKLKEADIGGLFSNLEQQYSAFKELEQTQIGYRKIILDTIRESKRALDIKDNSRKLTEETARLFSQKMNAPTTISGNFSLENLFINDLGFSELGYQKFSNSKVFGQILTDLYNICKNHSPNLVYDKVGNRVDDMDSTKINTEFIPRKKAYKFRNWRIGTQSTESNTDATVASVQKFNATDYKDYTNFVASLPTNENDKIKVLLISLSNELVISAGIGHLIGTAIGNRFNVNTPDPFHYAIGRIRDNILDDGFPPGSLSSLVLIEDSSQRLILPFETRNFYDAKGRNAIAGSVALVDVITRSIKPSGELNYEPYRKFATDLSNVTTSVTDYLDQLLNLSDDDKTLHASSIYVQILGEIKKCISKLSNLENKGENQIIIASLLRLAQNNSRIKHLLLRYVLELRDARDQLAKNSEFLEPDAEDPKSRVPSPFVTLSNTSKQIGKSNLTSQIIQKRYGITPNVATNMIRETSSSTNMYVKAKNLQASENLQKNKEDYMLANKWQNTSLWISVIAKNIVDDQVRYFQNINDKDIIKINEAEIASALKESAGNEESPFINIIRLSRDLQQKATQLSNRNFRNKSFMNSKRLTKYSSWDENALITVVFEIFCSLYSRYIDAEIFSKDSILYVNHNREKSENANKAINSVISVSSSEYGASRNSIINGILESKNNSLFSIPKLKSGDLKKSEALNLTLSNSTKSATFTDMYSFFDSLEKELHVKNLLISHLQSISYLIENQADNVEKIFNIKNEDISIQGEQKFNNQPKTEISLVRRYLAHKASTQIGRDLLSTLTEHQVALQRISDSNIFTEENDPSYISTEVIINAEETTALKSLVNSAEMLDAVGSNIRVLSVGIPYGMIDILQNPPYVIGTKNNSEITNASDIFEVHVHKRDLEFEDIVFKPKKFIFDRSVFLQSTSFKKIKSSETVGKIQKNVNWKINDVINNLTFTVSKYDQLLRVTPDQLINNNKYSTISRDKRLQILKNHTVDRLLQTYYRLINGVIMDEGTFIKHSELLNLCIDSAAINLLKLSQIDPRTSMWVNTGTVPIANLLIERDFYGEKRTFVATFKDAEIFTKPTITQLQNLARDFRVANRGELPETIVRARALEKKKEKQEDNKTKKNKKIIKQKNKEIKTKEQEDKSKEEQEDNKKIVQQRSLLMSYENEALRHIHSRFFVEKPMLSAEQMQHFRMLCASTIFSSKSVIRRIISPRLFDRVLMIPLDPDDFEIDLVATRKLLSGKTSKDREEFKQMIVVTKNQYGEEIAKLKPRRRIENHSSFNDFFVTISTVTTGDNS